MAISNTQIIKLRKERGWSQEKLAVISGLSERTIQRIEKDGSCSLDSQMALAQAFDLAPTELKNEDLIAGQDGQMETDWAGAIGLMVLGLVFPLIVLMTGTDGMWEMASFFTVIGLTVILSIMNHGGRNTYRLFDKTSWIVRHPVRVKGLNHMIIHAQKVIHYAYTIGLIAAFVTGLTLSIHKPEMFETYKTVGPIILKPILYAVMFSEFWFRPYKHKMERMLRNQLESS